MDDIVEQLRTEAEVTAGAGGGSLLERAADEIMWLRAELAHAQRMRLATVKAVQDVVLAYDKAEAKRWRERNR